MNKKNYRQHSTYASEVISWMQFLSHIFTFTCGSKYYENFNYNREISFLFVVSFRKLTFGFWYLYLLFVCPHAGTQTCNLHFHRKVNCGKFELWFNGFVKIKGFCGKLRLKLMMKDIYNYFRTIVMVACNNTSSYRIKQDVLSGILLYYVQYSQQETKICARWT